MKTMQEIYESLCGRIEGRSGVSVTENGELSLRLHAVAYEIYSLYAQSDWVRRQCFPQFAVGEELDVHASLRGLVRQEAAKAKGMMRFSVHEPAVTELTVSAGTVCTTLTQRRFVTAESGVIAIGESFVEVAAEAEEAGSGGSMAAGEILVMSAPVYGVASCANEAAFFGGRDAESDEALRARVLESYALMQNGANVGYYKTVAMSMDGVAAAEIFPLSRGGNTLDVVVASADGIPSGEVLAAVSAAFEARRELGVDVLVRAPERAYFSPVIVLRMAAGGDFEAARATVAARLEAALGGRCLGRMITGDLLTAWIGTVDGVQGYAVVAPEGGFDPGRDCLPSLGAVEILDSRMVDG